MSLSTPTSRLKLTPSNSPYHTRPSARSPNRGRPPPDTKLSLRRVVGTTCNSPTGFDTSQSSFAYVAGGAAVVVDLNGLNYSQRFFRARPTAIPVYPSPTLPYSPATPSTPKANDSRNRAPIPLRESSYNLHDWSESPSSKTWTSRERIKTATCLALSREGKFLAVGETGYQPRVLIFSLDESSSDKPLVAINEHAYGVNAVAWSHDSRFLASLGVVNDGFLYLWRVDPKTGAAKLFQQNRCTSYVRGMLWMGNSLITLGVRHVKVWRVDEAPSPSATKQRFHGTDSNSASPSSSQRSLPGRNILLGALIEATFSCGAAIDTKSAIICSEAGDLCLYEDSTKQPKLTKVLEIGFVTSCVAVRDKVIYVSGKTGEFATINLKAFVNLDADCIQKTTDSSVGLHAIGFLKDNLVTLGTNRSIDIWKASYIPGSREASGSRMRIPGHGGAIRGVDALCPPTKSGSAFYTWSSSGHIVLWDLRGHIIDSLHVDLDEGNFENEADPNNQLAVVRATKGPKYFVAGDRLGIMKVIDYSTKECVYETKAHSSNCQSIAILEDGSKLLIATCGRDRTTQLFMRTSNNEFEHEFEHFQTVEFSSKVAQVIIPSPDRFVTISSTDRYVQLHDLITKEGDPDAMAAIPAKTLPLKATPLSMAVTPDGKFCYISALDRSVYVYDVETNKQAYQFKCTDETGIESVNIDCLTHRPANDTEPAFLLCFSNTDKSIRLYDANTGGFLDREWGHTEAINGVALIEDGEANRHAVSVGVDGTIMIWALDLREQRSAGPASRDSSPVKDTTTSSRPPLRRVLSKAELAEFQRSSPNLGRRSPPRTLIKRRSLYNLSFTPSSKTPVTAQASPSSTFVGGSPCPKPSASSPPSSPRSLRVSRHPSLPAITPLRSKSNSNLKGLASLNKATEQTCRALRSFRKKLASADPINSDVLAEMDQELRLTSLALGDRAQQSMALSESTLNNILDQYSTKLVSMLETKLQLTSQEAERGREGDSSEGKRPGSSGTGSTSSASDSA